MVKVPQHHQQILLTNQLAMTSYGFDAFLNDFMPQILVQHCTTSARTL